MLAPDELLDAIAGTLRQQVGPAVNEPFAKTQAFMAAVILEKVAGDLRTAAHRADGDVRRDVVAGLRATLGVDVPKPLTAAIDALERDTSAAWRKLVEALYATRTELGDERFGAALARLRTTLRTRLDRSLAEQR